jgi:hypothetical protein
VAPAGADRLRRVGACCRLLAAASDQQRAAAFSKLLDQYEQKDQLAQQLEGITKLQVRSHPTGAGCALGACSCTAD